MKGKGLCGSGVECEEDVPGGNLLALEISRNWDLKEERKSKGESI